MSSEFAIHQFPSPAKIQKKIRLPQSVPPLLPERIITSPIPIKFPSKNSPIVDHPPDQTSNVVLNSSSSPNSYIDSLVNTNSNSLSNKHKSNNEKVEPIELKSNELENTITTNSTALSSEPNSDSMTVETSPSPSKSKSRSKSRSRSSLNSTPNSNMSTTPSVNSNMSSSSRSTPSTSLSSSLSSSFSSPSLSQNSFISEKKFTVETELEKNGFTLKDKVFTEKDGQVFARFIKAVNICGQLVYIELDTDGFVGINAHDFHLIESSTPSLISTKFKTYTYDRIMKDEILNKTICGIVFECQTGICSCIRHGSTMIETNFLYPNVDQATVPISSICVPCIRMSEIQKPIELETTHRNISETAIRLRTINFNQSQNSLANLLGTVDSFRYQYITFIKRQEEIFNKLISTTKELEEYYQRYETISNKDGKKFSQLLFNLRKRYHLTTELFTLCQNISNFTTFIQDETKELSDLNNYLDKEFKGIDSILTE